MQPFFMLLLPPSLTLCKWRLFGGDGSAADTSLKLSMFAAATACRLYMLLLPALVKVDAAVMLQATYIPTANSLADCHHMCIL